MKKAPLLLFAFFIAVAPVSPAKAQSGEAAKESDDNSVQASTVTKPAVTQKKPAARKKAAKKKQRSVPEPESAYKFKAAVAPPAYKFDKEGNPIAKQTDKGMEASKKNKKNAAKGVTRTADRSIPQLKKTTLTGGNAAAARYICPMRDYEGDKPGQCPKCGMTLVEKKQ